MLRLASAADVLSVAALLLTVCVLPWLLGGAIPLARLVLQIGTLVAAGLSFPAMIVGQRHGSGIPMICLPLVVIAAIGILQLVPIHTPITSRMNHAVMQEVRSDLNFDSTELREPASASPADTRLIVAQLMALILLASTTFNSMRSKTRITVALWAISINAAAIVVTGLLQQFSGESLLLGNDWWTGRGGPFATFVNGNNAAGWLCIGLAAAVGLSGILFSGSRHRHSMGHRPIRSGTASLTDRVLFRISNLTVWQLVCCVLLTVIAAGIAATGSRGGIVAATIAISTLAVRRLTLRHIIRGAVLAIVVLGISWGILAIFHLDSGVVAEMQTLNDPLAEAGGRLYHWSDTLVMVQDFPLLGSGLGAYKYATLPYQQHDLQVWMQNADNHYVEVLIESGITGLAAFLSIGVIALFTAWTLARFRRASVSSQTRLAGALASTNLAMIAALSFSALFDFGVGSTSTSAAFILIASMSAAHAFTLKSRNEELVSKDADKPARSRLLAVATSGPALVMFTMCVVATVAAHLPDLWSVTKSHPNVVAAYRCLPRKVSLSALDQQRQVRDSLIRDALRRPDDPEVQRMLLQLEEALLRQTIMRDVVGQATLSEKELKSVWQLTNPVALQQRVYQLSKQEQGPDAERMSARINSLVEQSEFLMHCDRVEQKFPLMAGVTGRSALWQWTGDTPDDTFEQQVTRVVFVEPNDSGMLFRLGLVSITMGNEKLAMDLWKRSISITDRQRSWILSEAIAFMDLEKVWRHFGPVNFEQCVVSLQHARQPVIRDRLRREGDKFWNEPIGEPSNRTIDMRGAFLTRTGQSEELIRWYKKCLEWNPKDRAIRIRLAGVLEQQQQFRESLAEWRLIQALDYKDLDASVAIERLEQQIHSPRQ